jgi:hypothetical protein
MKKMFLVAVITIVLNSVTFGDYRAEICALRGTTDVNAVTLQERIVYCIGINCARIQNGTITKSQIFNNERFTDAQLIAFHLMGTQGSLDQRLIKQFMADPTVRAQLANTTDAQLDAAFLYVVWPIAVLIGNGQI